MFLKIAVMNNSGNVGKSAICETLLVPRLPDSDLIKIETINSDGTKDETISAKDLIKVQQLIDQSDVSVIDVGASNIEIFMNNMKRIEGMSEDIDYYLIPTTPKPKQQNDTLATINNLLDLGVSIEKIKLIFNFCDEGIPLERQYSIIFGDELSVEMKLDKPENQYVIYENSVFDVISQTGKTFESLLNDNRDFKTLIRNESDLSERNRLSVLRSAQRLAKGFNKHLDLVFSKLNIV